MIIFLLLISISAFSKEISLSFDDAPRANSQYFTGDERTKVLIEKLQKAGVSRAAFYVNTNKLQMDNGLARIQQYKKAGHLIGNHTHSHINIKKSTVQKFLKDFDDAHLILAQYGIGENFFRYPYLKRGKDLFEVSKIHNYVLAQNYTDAFVTIDNFDFHMDTLFQKTLRENKKINYENLKNFYVETLYKSVEFYSELAIETLGGEVKHVMLLHENDLAALFIGDFVTHLQDKGWTIVTPEQSYSDPTTKYFPENILNHGQGRVVSLALDKGYQGPTNSGYEDTTVLENLFIQYKISN